MLTDRQLEIIAVSHDIINNYGIQGFTIKNIAKAIGISEPAIYRHYESKIDILLAILEDFQNLSYNMFQNAAVASVSSSEKIALVFRNHFNAFLVRPSLSAVVFSEEIFRNEETLKNRISQIMDQNRLILTDIIIMGQQKNEIRTDIEAAELALMTMGSLRLLVKKWQMSGSGFKLEEEGEKIIKMIKLLIK